MKITEKAVGRPVTTFMVFMFLVLMGLFAATKLDLDLLPKIDPPVVSVVTSYPGANASDVETNLTRHLENGLSTVSGLDTMTSVSKDNLSVVTLKFKWGTNLDTATSDVRDQVDMTRKDLPSDSDKPVLIKMSTSNAPVMILGVTATDSFKQLYQIVDKRLVDHLKRVPGVGAVIVIGGVERQILVEFGQRKLAAHGLTFGDVARALKGQNLNVPAGELKLGSKQFVLRVPERYKGIQQIKDTVVAIRNGRAIRLGDVAVVRDAFKEPVQHLLSHFGPSMILLIQKQSGANTVNVVADVKKVLPQIKATLPADVKIMAFMDWAKDITNSLRNLFTSILFGAVLVVLVTFLFLRRWRPSLIISLAIPFSLIVSFAFMLMLDYSLNTISMMSLAIAIGMVVDNAVVVLENITRHQEEYAATAKSAAVYGTQEVGTAVMASTLTTIAMFAPLLMMSGLVGILFKPLAAVVTVTLMCSFFLAMTLTPTLASKLMAKQKEPKGLAKKISDFGERGFGAIDNLYAFFLDKALRVRWLVVILAVFLFAASLFAVKYLGSEFFPNADSGDIEVTIELPTDTRLEETTRVARQVLGIFKRLVPEQTARWAVVGQSEEGMMSAFGIPEGKNVIWGGMKLVSVEKRKRSVSQIAQVIRRELMKIPGIDKLSINDKGGVAKMMGMEGKPIQIEISGFDLEVLKKVTLRVKGIVKSVKGAVEVTTTLKPDRRELWVRVDRDKASRMGVPVSVISQAVRAAFYGLEATKYFDAGDEYKIFLRLSEKRRRTIDDVLAVEVRTASGRMVPLRGLVKVVDKMGPVQVDRKDQARMIKVEAGVYGTSVGQVAAAIKRELKKFDRPPGVRIKFGGDVEEQEKSFGDMSILLLLGIIIVFMVMASQFESLKGPFVVMFAMPFAFSGMVLGCLIGGVTLNLISFMGLVMLMGIVVNNAIVLVDYVNLLRAQGVALREALIEGGRRRLRPVLMTATTTLMTMIPLALSTAEGHETWAPLGWAMLGGLTVSTMVTMIVVPVLYSFMLRRGETVSLRKLRRQEAKAAEAALGEAA